MKLVYKRKKRRPRTDSRGELTCSGGIEEEPATEKRIEELKMGGTQGESGIE